MLDADRLSGLVSDIYGVTLDPELWPNVLRSIAEFVGGAAAVLMAQNDDDRDGSIYYDSGGIDPRCIQFYVDACITLDAASAWPRFARAEEPVATADLIAYDEFLQTKFYRECVRPQGLVDVIGAVLDRTATSIAMLGVFRRRRDGLVDEDARRRMRLIVPHVRRAVLIGRTIDLRATESANLANAFDGIASGLFLLDAIGRIVLVNAVARAILAAGDVLTSGGGRLTASNGEADRELRDALAVVRSGNGGITGIAVPLIARDGARHVAHVLPLTSGRRRRAGRGYAAVAALFVHKAALDAPSPLEVIAKSYRLTPTELRVLLAVVEVGGAPEVAATLGIADSTVKTHLRRLYEKTGARRHADLVKLVAEYSNRLIR